MEKQPEDEILEEFVGRMGIMMELTPEERCLFSISEDVSPAHLSAIMRAFKISEHAG